ncbi:MAG: GC-type dockerin domain-anchored protein [Phycisphaerales bacterium]|jgi:hypothetical protein
MLNRSMTVVAAVLGAAGLSSSVHAQCSVYRLGMPDFDQRRSVLPNDGSAYCVPTATANALAYISNHGQPAVFGGPRDWQSQSQYDYVNTQLTTMGLFMGTDPEDGTGVRGWRLTTEAYARNGDGLLVGSYQAFGEIGVNPLQMANHMRLGTLVMPIIGWYDELDVNRYERDGGHVVTMWGGSNLCDGPDDMRMLFRDPGNDRWLFDQSDFATTFTMFEYESNWRFKYDSESQYFSRPIYQLTSTTRGFLDGFLYIMPAFGLMTDPITQDVDARVPLPFTDEPGRRVFDADPTPAFTTVIAMDQGLTPIEAFVLTRSERTGAGTLHTLDVISGQMTAVGPVASPRGVASSLDGSVFVAGASDLVRYTPQLGGGLLPTGNLALPFPVDAMTYDDETRELYFLSRARRRLMRVSEGLVLLESSAIPSEVELSPHASIAINSEPDGGASKVTILVSDTGGVSELTRDVTGRLIVASSSKLPGVTDPHSLQLGDDGVLYAVDDSIVHAFERDSMGDWQAVDRPLAGERTGPVFRVGRGRSNFNPATMDDVNRLPPDDDGGKPDCRADLDLDGELTIFDFLEFQNLFASGSTWADFDCDGELTIFDFLAFQNAFDAGCP